MNPPVPLLSPAVRASVLRDPFRAVDQLTAYETALAGQKVCAQLLVDAVMKPWPDPLIPFDVLAVTAAKKKLAEARDATRDAHRALMDAMMGVKP